MSPTSRPASLTQRAYEALTERLVLLDIPPGAPLHEQELSEQLQIGRTPLREAVKRLEGDHLVVTYPRRGTFASPVDLTALSEISEIRAALEPVAARAAAQRADAADRPALEGLRAGLARLPQDARTRDQMDHDRQVHRALHRAARNAHLEAALTRYGNLATRIWSVAAPGLSDVGAHVVELDALLAAVLARDADRAEALMRAHTADFQRRIRTVL